MMDTKIIQLYREEARVFRTAMEKSIKHEMQAQEAQIAKTGKKAGLQTISKKACGEIADLLDSMGAILANNAKPETTTSANAIDRMVADFGATSADLRGLASGAVRARTPEEKEKQESEHASALKALQEAQAALDALNRNQARLS